ncbi:Uncharacterized phage-associated protein [Chryseobacterium sp. RU37D]|uniref:Panacea domain-containing protein n=1 Tax=Chryseobacterium sp. RU37D TaxID=1907397 RepID=UPI0009565736|nr:type II toxin-antitoxin system antitoxin SocA domain-containing protein [Chryseobacterium sp. RU37D]SIQ69822.1 Uncharacterized phage-associated protein [Chryseobacterium sp. RU37D]
MYTCFDIAKQFLKLAREDGEVVEPMKLLKLTYIAHGWYLGFFDKPLIKNTVQAWKYGPVIPELYHVIKRFGFGNVEIEIIDLYSENKLSNTDKSFIKTIWNTYKGFTGLQLSTKTHMKNTPWDEAYDPKIYHKTISNELIKEHYKKLIDERR